MRGTLPLSNPPDFHRSGVNTRSCRFLQSKLLLSGVAATCGNVGLKKITRMLPETFEYTTPAETRKIRTRERIMWIPLKKTSGGDRKPAFFSRIMSRVRNNETGWLFFSRPTFPDITRCDLLMDFSLGLPAQNY